MNYWSIKSKQNLISDILKTTENDLKKNLNKDSIENYYKKSFIIEKKKSQRVIYSIDKENELYNLQKKLKNNFLDNILLSSSAFGYRKGRNYFDYMYPHIIENVTSLDNVSLEQNQSYVKLDISNFFDSIRYEELKSTLMYYIEDTEEKDEIIEIIMNIITFENKVIQGSVTSPTISNIYFRKLDYRIEKYCEAINVTYTRYSDDMLFSSNKKKLQHDSFIHAISNILSVNGFKLNQCKTLKSLKYISVNGYRIEGEVSLSRKKTHKIRLILYNVLSNYWKSNQKNFEKLNSLLKENNLTGYFTTSDTLLNYLKGYRSYMILAIKYLNNQRSINKYNEILKRIELAIIKVERQKH